MTLEEKIKAFPVLCYTRVCGWLAPTSAFNKGKAQEYKDRVEYSKQRKEINEECS